MLIHVWLKGMPTWPLAMNLPELHEGLEASAELAMLRWSKELMMLFCKPNRNEWKSFLMTSIIGLTFLRMPA